MKRIDALLRFGLLILLSLIIFSMNPNFGKVGNLINILRQGSLLYILGIGMTIVILTRGIDLSNGAVLALSSCVVAIAMEKGVPIIIAVIISLAIGMACGAANGIMVAYANIPSFVATFAMSCFARGLAYIFLGGRIIHGFSDGFRFIGTGSVCGIPMPVMLSILLLFIFYLMLEHTPFGMNIYAIGSNIESCRLAGIKTKKTIVIVYLLSGFLSAFAGLVYTARLNTAEPVIGASFPLDAIAAVVIGGTSLTGGEGSLSGTAIGVLILTVIINGMNMMGISSLWQQFVTGSIILIMITVQTYSKNVRLKNISIFKKGSREELE
ncbi:ribose ABC transporter permease [Candidatus Atribacteria bacterium HGW-Atribacteria-1]|nr:MAG: ribose ABC transporter permease [Candidatus Atribacteria bacterium HGW-Atribacteria-1]